jgi:hypothetical protein
LTALDVLNDDEQVGVLVRQLLRLAEAAAVTVLVLVVQVVGLDVPACVSAVDAVVGGRYDESEPAAVQAVEVDQRVLSPLPPFDQIARHLPLLLQQYSPAFLLRLVERCNRCGR